MEKQKKVEQIDKTLKQFNVNLKERLAELSEMECAEICLLKDESKGLHVEFHSRQLNINQLSQLGLSAFDWLQKQRETKTMTGV